MYRILHLVDDTGPGGVTRYLEFLTADADLRRCVSHQVLPVSRTRPATGNVEADLIVSHLTVTWRGLPGLMALRARHAGTPMVHVEHSYCAGFVAHKVTARRRFHTLLRSAYALFDRVVAVSEAQADWLRLRDLVAENALSVIPPCVDLAPFRALPAPTDHRVIGAIGRFDRQKGFDLLIRAFCAQRDPSLRLRLVGDGEQRARLRELAEGDTRISFEGFTADPVAAMRACDMIAMPSRWEPYGLVALEALAARRPLLVSSADGLADHSHLGAHMIRGASPEDWSEALGTRHEKRTPHPHLPEDRCRVLWEQLAGSFLVRQEPLVVLN